MITNDPSSLAKRILHRAGIWVLCLIASLISALTLSRVGELEFRPSTIVVLGIALTAAALMLRDHLPGCSASAASAHRVGPPEETKRAAFQQLPLRAHAWLADVPLHSLDPLELRGGPAGMKLPEISRAVGFTGAEMEVGWITSFLFWLRGLIGRLLHWDDARELVEAKSILPRLSPEDRARSLIPPGTPAGIARILFQSEHEMLGEIINRTVHCFWLLAAEESNEGYRLWFAVYVRRLNWFTPVYMTLISPVLKWIIYPAMLRGARKSWEQSLSGMTRETR